MEHDLPDVGEVVIATYRCAGEPYLYHGFLSREDDGENVVWCCNYSQPRWNDFAKQWQSEDGEYDDEYEVAAWVRLPAPPTADQAPQGRKEQQ